ncbi:MAG: ligase-associated DNA damage response endonuclease PdeM [Pseudomonadota bacterium]|nr:ligase-associated DNA damage response endonuclease PdeM [Pseudomonadota bacterium]
MNTAAIAYRYAVAALPTGALRLDLAGVEALCRPAGALWLEAWRALIVADLHLEKGSAYAARGQLLPPYDTRDTLTRLEAEVAALAPRVLIFLGDTFHDRDAEARLAADDLERLRVLSVGRTLVWVLGNHDSAAPHRLPGETTTRLTLGAFTLVHEPGRGPRPAEIAGHLHPCAKVRTRSASVRRRCFVTDGERLILPAFGAFAGGLNIRDPAFAGLLARRPLAAVLGAGRVHAVGWLSLRGD